MEDGERLSLEQIQAFLKGSGEVQFSCWRPWTRRHETLSGPATQKILQWTWHEFHDQRYERLARLSAAQLYRLRKSRTYRQRRIAYVPTRPTQVALGERRRPDPQGRPRICY